MADDGLRKRLETLCDEIEKSRLERDAVWCRTTTILHQLRDVLNPPKNTDTRAVPEVPEPPKRAVDRRTRHD